MAEQLSQSQIDALLKRMSSGDTAIKEEESKVKEYDFKSPKKFTKEQFKALDSLHETFSRLLASYLSGLLRVVCDIEVLQIEEQRYYEYNNAIPDIALLGLIEVQPKSERYDDARMVLNLSTEIGFYLIDRVLGGSGKGYSLTRNYTDLEISILSNVFTNITKRIKDTWENYFELEAVFAGIETNARFLQAYAPEDIVVVVMMNLKLGNVLEAPLSICIPAEFLEQVMDTFSMRYMHSAKKQDQEKEELKKRIILENVCESQMEIKAVFDQFKLSLQDIMQLQPDDIIPLNKPIDSDILLTVDKNPWYTAKLGETKQKKAVKLQNIIDKRDEGVKWEKNTTAK